MITAKEYPSDFYMRCNNFTAMYCEIAMEAYRDALLMYGDGKKKNWKIVEGVDPNITHLILKKTMTTVVFSAMAAEAFINDYLAARLGDNVFLGVYNHSHYYEKLDRICTIFAVRNHKEQDWYKATRMMFTIRNEYVHSYSKEIAVEELINQIADPEERKAATIRVSAVKESGNSDVYEQYRAVFFGDADADYGSIDYDSSTPRAISNQDKKNITCGLNDGCFAMMALCDLIKAIDGYDKKTHLFENTFTPPTLFYHNDDEKDVRIRVFRAIDNFRKKESNYNDYKNFRYDKNTEET